MTRSIPTMRVPAILVLFVLLMGACSPIRSLAALSRSTDHFAAFKGDDRIRVERGAEFLASQISPLLTEAVRKVENFHRTPFPGQVMVNICATSEECYRLTGQRAPATVTNRLFLSPDLFRGNKPLDRYLTHELSHLHVVQRIGLFGAARVPSWFKEGLAELVSGGATGSSVPLHEAYLAFHEKRSFIPDDGRNLVSSFLFPRYGSHWHLENRMFYRQSMLFVEFMREYDSEAFDRFLAAVERGAEFKKALSQEYPGGIRLLWNKFLDKAQAMSG